MDAAPATTDGVDEDAGVDEDVDGTEGVPPIGAGVPSVEPSEGS